MTDSTRVALRTAASRRLRWVLFGGAALWLAVAARLVQVQGLDHDMYTQRARAQHERQISLSARRGEILDRAGRELAFDVASVSFYSHPAAVRDRDLARGEAAQDVLEERPRAQHRGARGAPGGAGPAR